MERNIQSVTREKAPVKRMGMRTVLLLPHLVQIAHPIADLQKQNRFIISGRIQSSIVDCFTIFFQFTICIVISSMMGGYL